MELYLEQGYEATTVAQIAERAGLTERTYFRHFKDKREVLFSGSPVFVESVLRAVRSTPLTVSPLDTVVDAFISTSFVFFDPRRHLVVQRQSVINANPVLQERELIKMSSLTAALFDELRVRGVAESVSRLAAEVGVLILKVAFENWVNDTAEVTLSEHLSITARQLRSLSDDETALSRARR